MEFRAQRKLLFHLTSSSDPQKHALAVSMIEKGADVDDMDNEGNMVLQMAIKSEAYNVIEAVLKTSKHARYLVHRRTNSPLALAMQSPNAVKLLTLFFDCCGLWFDRCAKYVPWDTSEDRLTTVAETLLRLAGRTGKEFDFRTILECILSNKCKLMKHLVNCKTDANERLINPQILLSYHSALDDPAVVASIVRAGADINGPVNERMEYPLHAACEHCKHETVRLMLQLGADATATDMFGRTPFLVNRPNFRASQVLNVTMKIMLKHLACLTHLGIEMHENDWLFIASEPIVLSFYEMCMDELDKMKTVEFADGLKYKCFLRKTSYELAVLMKNPSVFDQLKRSLLPCKPEIFPIYKTDLVAKFGVARQMCSILVAKERELENIVGGSLPTQVVHKLAYYLLDIKNIEREYYLNKFL